MEPFDNILANVERIKEFGAKPANRRELEAALEEVAQTGEIAPPSVDAVIAGAVNYVSDPSITHWERVASSSPENFWGRVEELAKCGVALSPDHGGAELVPCLEQEDVFTLVPLPGPQNILDLLTANPLVADLHVELAYSPDRAVTGGVCTLDLKDGQQITASQEFLTCSPARPGSDPEQRAADSVIHLAASKFHDNFPGEAKLLENALMHQAVFCRSVENTMSVLASRLTKENVTKSGESLQVSSSGESEGEAQSTKL